MSPSSWEDDRRRESLLDRRERAEALMDRDALNTRHGSLFENRYRVFLRYCPQFTATNFKHVVDQLILARDICVESRLLARKSVKSLVLAGHLLDDTNGRPVDKLVENS